MVRAVGMAREAAPATGMDHAGRAIGMGHANTQGMALRHVPAANLSTAGADRPRRRRPIASTSHDRATSQVTDKIGRALPGLSFGYRCAIRPPP
jgi:hypothetical protein